MESSMKYYLGQLNQHFNSQNKLVDSENIQFSDAWVERDSCVLQLSAYCVH